MTIDELRLKVVDYKLGNISGSEMDTAFQQYIESQNSGKPIVSRSPLFGIFSFAGGRYVGYWSSYEAAEQVMHDEYNDDEWYVDELVCQDCG